jgi:hypothetical protein
MAGQSADADIVKTEDFINNGRLIEGYAVEDIYIAHKTGLFNKLCT